jgi:hypothetical protein
MPSETSPTHDHAAERAIMPALAVTSEFDFVATTRFPRVQRIALPSWSSLRPIIDVDHNEPRVLKKLRSTTAEEFVELSVEWLNLKESYFE